MSIGLPAVLRANRRILIVFAAIVVLPLSLRADSSGVEASPRWVRVNGNTTQHLRDVHFSSPSWGWIGGENLTILRSTTGGSSWSPMVPNEGWASAPDCCMSVSTRELPSPEAWLAGPNKALRFGATSNSGAYSYGAVVLHAVFTIPGTGITWYGGSTSASGGSLRMYRKDGSGTLNVIFFNGGTVRGIFFANETEGWAVATAGTIVHITNGTAAKPDLNVSGIASVNLNGIFMLNRTIGWIAGDGGTILHTRSGMSWEPQYSGTVNRLRDVAFRDASNGVIVGDAGLILTTSDGGASWIVEPSGSSDDLYGVSWAGTVAFAVGNNGTILKRIEGGPARRRPVRR